MDLSGTAWQVVAIDGRRVEAQRVARMIFPDLSSAILSTVCGDFTAEMTMDADGSALTFGELAGNERPCPADMRAWQASVLDAISATESWRVEGQGVIELVGAHTVRMERVSD